MTRREMLSRSAGAAGATIAGLTFTAGCQSLSKNTPNSNFDKKGFKIGACDWTLRKRGDTAALEVARRIGLDGVQISMGSVRNDMHLRKPEIQEAYRQASKKYNVQIASLAIGELNKVPYKSDPRTDQWVSDSIDVCQKMGMQVVLLAFFGRHICEFHAKDYKDLYGKGSIDFPKVRLAMDDIGYRGWIHMEGTKFPLGREESCRYDLQYLRRVFPPKV